MLDSGIGRFGGRKENFKKDKALEDQHRYIQENIVSEMSGETKLGQ